MKTNDVHNRAVLFLSEMKKLGWVLERYEGHIITVSKTFPKNDKEAFSRCDSEAFQLLDMVPLKGGSVWGTDGGSVGGASALKDGKYVLNKSGVSGVSFLNALSRILETR